MVATRVDPARVRRVAQELRARGHDVRTLEEARAAGTLRSSPPGPPGVSDRGLADLRRLVGSRRLADRYDLVTRVHLGSNVHVVSAPSALSRPRLPTPGAARTALLACLETVFGVGPATAARLRDAGVRSVADMAGIDRYAAAAAEVLAEWDVADLAAIAARLVRRLGGLGHVLSSLTCALAASESVVFFDLETMGLWQNAVFLAGVGRVEGDCFVVRQYLAPSFADERAVIALALDELARSTVVVTFNGRSADLPWLASRAFYYGLGPMPEVAHVDLLHGTRRRFVTEEGVLADARLPTVAECLLGLPRPALDIPSSLVPQVYEDYTGDPEGRQGLLGPVLDHNRADLEALVLLLERLSEEAVRCS